MKYAIQASGLTMVDGTEMDPDTILTVYVITPPDSSEQYCPYPCPITD